MTHCEMILDFFRQNNNQVTLGKLLEAGYGCWAHSLTRRLSDLRAKGYGIECIKGDNPSKNLYILTEKEEQKETYRYDGNMGVFNF